MNTEIKNLEFLIDSKLSELETLKDFDETFNLVKEIKSLSDTLDALYRKFA